MRLSNRMITAIKVAVFLAALVPFARIDPVWKAALVERSPHLFLAAWPVLDWARVAWSFTVVAISLTWLTAAARRLALMTIE